MASVFLCSLGVTLPTASEGPSGGAGERFSRQKTLDHFVNFIFGLKAGILDVFHQFTHHPFKGAWIGESRQVLFVGKVPVIQLDIASTRVEFPDVAFENKLRRPLLEYAFELVKVRT